MPTDPTHAVPSSSPEARAKPLPRRLQHGYRCSHGDIYFAGSRKRVTIAIDDALIATTLGAVANARRLTEITEAPPPRVRLLRVPARPHERTRLEAARVSDLGYVDIRPILARLTDMDRDLVLVGGGRR
jgi:hypothetical protein